MVEYVNLVADMYMDACMFEAMATWNDDARMQEKADVAWHEYDGAKRLLSLVFGLTEEQVDEDIELLATGVC